MWLEIIISINIYYLSILQYSTLARKLATVINIHYNTVNNIVYISKSLFCIYIYIYLYKINSYHIDINSCAVSFKYIYI